MRAELPIAEEKSSGENAPITHKPEEKTSDSSEKMGVYNGLGRRHNDEQMDEILDWYLLTGQLPKYVSDRQRLSYRKHPRLELRRMYLEQAGLIKTGKKGKHKTVSGTAESQSNVPGVQRKAVQRRKRTS